MGQEGIGETHQMQVYKDLPDAVAAISKSHKLIKKAIADNINTGWYAVTPKEKLTWTKSDSDEDASDES